MPTQEYARFTDRNIMCSARTRSRLSLPYYISFVPTVIVLFVFVNVQLNIHSLWGIWRNNSGDEKGGGGADSHAEE
jgi:hypothetical protein